MSQFSKTNSNEGNLDLSIKEVEFLLTKLRSAQYRGEEFEFFFNVWTKLANHIKKQNK